MGWLIIPQFNSFIQSFSLALEKLDSIHGSLKSLQEVDVVMNLEKKMQTADDKCILNGK